MIAKVLKRGNVIDQSDNSTRDKIKYQRLSFEKKKKLYGLAFLSFWLVGLFQYFFRPLFNLVLFSFSDLYIHARGYELINFGTHHYYHITRVDPTFIRNLAISFGELAYQVPVTIVFSVFIALLLNQKFRGRTFMRAVFFIPVIIASGIVMSIIEGDIMAQMLRSGDRNIGTMLQINFGDFLFRLGLPLRFVQTITGMASDIFSLVWKSGVQIVILLAGLQTIPPSLYEASSIEGATGWENLWKITIPMISPMLVLVTVYTIIDAFISFDNWLMRDIMNVSRQLQINRASAMAFMYFLIVLVVVAIVYIVVNRRAFYMNDEK